MNESRCERERRIVARMIALYCRAHHASAVPNPAAAVHDSAAVGLCPDCRALTDYTAARLARCCFGDAKPSCRRCPVHCYSPAMRERIRQVMRWAGPRMLLRTPVEALRHLL